MQRNRLILLALAAVVIIGGFVAASGDPSSSGHKPKTDKFTVRVVGGKPAGGIAKLSAAKSDTIELTVQSDVADEIHLHGYDYKKAVNAGGSVHFSFPASIAGIFVIELESRSEQIASLEVGT